MTARTPPPGRTTAPPRVLVLQHVEQETAGAYGPALESLGIELVIAAADRPPLPDWRGCAGVLVMGGPMGACDEARLPWLAAEKAWIRAVVCAGLPFFGVCLGAQLLAASLGARVWRGPRPEIGVAEVSLTDDGAHDCVFSVCEPSMRVLQWHGDSFDLPRGARRLWTSTAYANQAFRVGGCAYGVQFHLEATADMVRRWAQLPAYRRDLQTGAALAALLADVERHQAEILDCALDTIARWAHHHVICSHAGRLAPVAGGEVPRTSSEGLRGLH